MKKIILSAFTATSLLLPSAPVFAGPLTISLGIPQEHTFSEKNESGSKIEADGSSGYFLGIKFPVGFGLGMDSYETKIKCTGCPKVSKLSTSMYNLYYLLPIPIINLTLGIGTGKSQWESEGQVGDDGTATQFYTSIGVPIMPLFDLHLSYRSISSKIESTSGSDKGKKDDVGGNIMGLGIGFNF